jgi:hypothetical protein
MVGCRRQIAMLESSSERQIQRLHAENESLEREHQAKITRIQVCNPYVSSICVCSCTWLKCRVGYRYKSKQLVSFGMFLLALSLEYFILIFCESTVVYIMGAHSSIAGWGTMLQAGRSWVRFPMRTVYFFSWPNPSSHTMALRLTQPLTKMSTRNHPGG